MPLKEGSSFLNIVVPTHIKEAIVAQAGIENSSASRIAARIIIESEEVKQYVENAKQDTRHQA